RAALITVCMIRGRFTDAGRVEWSGTGEGDPLGDQGSGGAGLSRLVRNASYCRRGAGRRLHRTVKGLRPSRDAGFSRSIALGYRILYRILRSKRTLRHNLNVATYFVAKTLGNSVLLVSLPGASTAKGAKPIDVMTLVDWTCGPQHVRL